MYSLQLGSTMLHFDWLWLLKWALPVAMWSFHDEQIFFFWFPLFPSYSSHSLVLACCPCYSHTSVALHVSSFSRYFSKWTEILGSSLLLPSLPISIFYQEELGLTVTEIALRFCRDSLIELMQPFMSYELGGFLSLWAGILPSPSLVLSWISETQLRLFLRSKESK